jgi:hypothetical protein
MELATEIWRRGVGDSASEICNSILGGEGLQTLADLLAAAFEQGIVCFMRFVAADGFG